ncbi:MAG: hypothetical protein EAZ24_01235 [Burkholderiales bacterium]|nr:MAG: hypothetical protein EAZ21_05025 [Betaproteobacteria bacterium]TAG84465.1 MAG: hypothetical protein EAZ24_01235 [Burkholderiales bacterium]
MKSIIALGFLLLWSSQALAQPAPTSAAREPEPSSRDWERILPVAADLKADGEKARADGKPILLFFNLSGCHFCQFSLRAAVVPMYRDPAFREAVIFRQITIDDGKTLIGFDGKRVSTHDFASQYKAMFTPTVMMVDGAGKQLGDSIVGVASIDFYSGYVETLAKAAIDSLKISK